MDTPAERVDRLLALAEEALDREDVDQAIAFVREAHTLAPLRKDIKEALSNLLMMSAPVDDSPAPARSRKSAVKARGRAAPQPDSDEEEDSAGDEEDVSQNSSLGSTRSFALAEFIRTGPDSPSVAQRPAPRKRSRPGSSTEEPGSISDILSRDFGFPSEDEAEAFCAAGDAPGGRQKTQRRADAEVPSRPFAPEPSFFSEEPPQPRPRSRGGKPARRTAVAEPDEDMDFVVTTPPSRPERTGPSTARRLVRRLSGASPRFVASAAVYGFIVVFVGTASIFSYVKFQSGGAREATRIVETIAEPKPVSPAPQQVAQPRHPHAGGDHPPRAGLPEERPLGRRCRAAGTRGSIRGKERHPRQDHRNSRPGL